MASQLRGNDFYCFLDKIRQSSLWFNNSLRPKKRPLKLLGTIKSFGGELKFYRPLNSCTVGLEFRNCPYVCKTSFNPLTPRMHFEKFLYLIVPTSAKYSLLQKLQILRRKFFEASDWFTAYNRGKVFNLT